MGINASGVAVPRELLRWRAIGFLKKWGFEMQSSAKSSESFDVVVVGTGLAGLAAALRAKEEGANVVVIDKAPETSMGGNSRFSGGALRTPSDTVSAADLVKENMDMSGGRANPRLTHMLYHEATEALQWLRDYGVPILRSDEERPDFKGSKMPWHAKGNGYGLIAVLFPNLAKNNISVRFEAKALRLDVDDNGAVRELRQLDAVVLPIQVEIVAQISVEHEVDEPLFRGRLGLG